MRLPGSRNASSTRARRSRRCRRAWPVRPPCSSSWRRCRPKPRPSSATPAASWRSCAAASPRRRRQVCGADWSTSPRAAGAAATAGQHAGGHVERGPASPAAQLDPGRCGPGRRTPGGHDRGVRPLARGTAGGGDPAGRATGGGRDRADLCHRQHRFRAFPLRPRLSSSICRCAAAAAPTQSRDPGLYATRRFELLCDKWKPIRVVGFGPTAVAWLAAEARGPLLPPDIKTLLATVDTDLPGVHTLPALGQA